MNPAGNGGCRHAQQRGELIAVKTLSRHQQKQLLIARAEVLQRVTDDFIANGAAKGARRHLREIQHVASVAVDVRSQPSAVATPSCPFITYS